MKLLSSFVAVVIALSVAGGIGSADQARASGKFVFTAIPDQDESKLRKRFGKVATYLSKELGLKVEYVPVKSYAAAVTAFRNNQVNGSATTYHPHQLGPKSGYLNCKLC